MEVEVRGAHRQPCPFRRAAIHTCLRATHTWACAQAAAKDAALALQDLAGQRYLPSELRSMQQSRMTFFFPPVLSPPGNRMWGRSCEVSQLSGDTPRAAQHQQSGSRCTLGSGPLQPSPASPPPSASPALRASWVLLKEQWCQRCCQA